MAKAVKNFIWQGKYIQVGDEAPEGVPKHLVEGEPQEGPDKVVKKITTKRKKKPAENKNGKPKTEDK